VKWLTSALLLVGALALQTALTLIEPAGIRVLDPFLLVVVYCGLSGGEVQGMLAGTAAGWIQDIQFGGPVVGLTALTRLLLGFAVGIVSTRFMIASAAARSLVIFAATLVDSVVFERLALLFEVPASDFSVSHLLLRAAVNAAVGSLALQAVELRRREARA
jgi:rod shape-determining protein MreD